MRALPEKLELNQNFPNPFNPATTITYSLPRPADVTLTILNVLGQQVETLVKEYQGAGTHRRVWNAEGLSSGVYFYSLQAGEFVEARKLLLLR